MKTLNMKHWVSCIPNKAWVSMIIVPSLVLHNLDIWIKDVHNGYLWKYVICKSTEIDTYEAEEESKFMCHFNISSFIWID